ncbi:MAG: YbaB/EbfC family nucleoid-associated protein [Patescibacteria group bacterium]
MFHKLKQFNDLRKKANSLRSKLAEETVTVDNGAIKLVMDGNQEVKTVEINRDELNPDKKKHLEDKVKDAMNDAVKKVQRVMAAKMRESGDLQIPGFGA